MNEFVTATGLPRSTLVHWIKKGLLPEPVRKNRTMAYYDPDSVERAAFISEMQSQDMPLSRIKKLLELKDKGLEVDSLVKLHQTVFGVKTDQQINQVQLCNATGLQPDQLEALIAAGLLLTTKSGFFNQEDVTVCTLYFWGFSEGMEISDFREIQKNVKEIVKTNMALSTRLTKNMSVGKSAEVKLQLIKNISGIQAYLGQRIFQNKVKERTKLTT